jgi:hypothetical protein
MLNLEKKRKIPKFLSFFLPPAMGCFPSKHQQHRNHGQIWKPTCITPAGETTGMSKEGHMEEAAGTTSNKSKENVVGKSDKKEAESGRRESVETGTGTNGMSVGSSRSSRSFRLRNLHKYLEGEQVAAGWPPWLVTFASEAIQGWVPLKADNFEKLEKVFQTHSLSHFWWLYVHLCIWPWMLP